LKLKYDKLLSNFASNLNLRHYTLGLFSAEDAAQVEVDIALKMAKASASKGGAGGSTTSRPRLNPKVGVNDDQVMVITWVKRGKVGRCRLTPS